MSFAALHKLVTYAIAALGLYALTLGGELGPGVQLAFASGLALSWFFDGEIAQGERYSRIWTGVIVAFLGVQVVRGVLGDSPLALALEFAGGIQVSRLFNRRGAREYQQIAVLAFLHLIAATVLSTEISYAFIFIGFVVVTPWMLALSHLRREIEANYPEPTGDAARTGTNLGRVLASRRLVGARFLAGTMSLAVPLFLMTGLSFFLFPRVGVGFLGGPRDEGRNVTGFGGNVELGRFGVIRDDPTVIMRVKPPARDLPRPERVALRLRGTAFDRYDGKRWERSQRATQGNVYSNRYFPLGVLPLPKVVETYKIVLDQLQEPVIFVPQGTVSVRMPRATLSARDAEAPLLRSNGVDVRYTSQDGVGVVYETDLADTSGVVDQRPLRGEARLRYLEMPDRHERVASLAREVTANATSDQQKAMMLQFFLRDMGDYTYTLDQPDTRGKVPLDVFLFEEKRGHCEYFATAMAIMLRSVGVPARNATGFLGGVWNTYGEYYSIRQGDAHSWVEAYIEGRGWMTFDPTPPGGQAAAAPDEGWFGPVSAMMDALRNEWTSRIVSYDLRSQVGALRRMFSWLSSMRRGGAVGTRGTVQDGTERATEGARNTALRALPYGVALAALVALAVFLWRRRRRGGRGQQAVLDASTREVIEIYRSLEKTLAAKGRARPPSTTPLAHVQRLTAEGFPAADAARTVTEAYMACRYGRAPLGPGRARALKALVRDVASAASRVP